MMIKKGCYMKFVIWIINFLLLFEQILPSNLPTSKTAFGELLVVQPTAMIALQYPYGILNPNYVTTSSSNGGSVSTSTNFAVLSTGTASNGSALLTSKKRLPYKTGQGCCTLFTSIFTTGVSGSSQQIGVGNLVSGAIQDGFFWGYYDGQSYDYNGVANGSYDGSIFGIIHTCNGRTYFYPQSAWNQDTFLGGGGSSNPSGITLHPTYGNVYKIQYQWTGFGAIQFYIENPMTGNFSLVHIIEYANANIITSLLNPTMQLMAQVVNAGNTSNIQLKNPSFSGFIEGYFDTNKDERNCIANSTTVYAIPNNSPSFNHILSIQNATTFNGVTNQVEVIPDFLSLMNTNATNNEVFVNIYLNPTFATPPTYEPINTILGTTTSVVNFSSSGVGTGAGYGQVSTVTVGSGSLLASIYLDGGTTLSLSLSDFRFKLEPGDVLCIAASRILGAGNILASLTWREDF